MSLVAPYTALSQTGALRLVRNAKLRNRRPIYIDAALGNATAAGAESARLIDEMRRTGDLRMLLRMERFVSANRLSLLRPLLTQTTALRVALERELGVPAVAARVAQVQ